MSRPDLSAMLLGDDVNMDPKEVDQVANSLKNNNSDPRNPASLPFASSPSTSNNIPNQQRPPQIPAHPGQFNPQNMTAKQAGKYK